MVSCQAMTDESSPIRNISDTALWIAAYRALETERRNPLFRDPFAKLLAGARGERILHSMRGAIGGAWSMAVRTRVIDDFVKKTVRDGEVDTVINLAAGLDTRPYRLELPSRLKWVEVDLPGMVAYKKKKLAGEKPVCQLERVALDLSDTAARRELFRKLGVASSRVLVITEGLLPYLSDDAVAAFSRDLHAETHFKWWVIDVVSPTIVKWVQKTWGKQLEAAQAKIQFGPKEGAAFFEKHGWKLLEWKSFLEEGKRLRRLPPYLFLPALVAPIFRSFAGIALLER